MPTEGRENPTLTHDLSRAVAGVAVMLLGTGVTFIGWGVSVSMMAADPAVAKTEIPTPRGPLPIILIPVIIGWAVYFAGIHVAGKSWAGVAARVAMGAVVLLFGIGMYVTGYTSEDRDIVLYLFSGTWLIGLGFVSIVSVLWLAR